MNKELLIVGCLGLMGTALGQQSTPSLSFPNPFAGITSLSINSHIDVESFEFEQPQKSTITTSFQTVGEKFKLNFKSHAGSGQLIADNTYGYDQDHYYISSGIDKFAQLQKKPMMNKPVLFGALGPLEAFAFLLPFSSNFQMHDNEPGQTIFQASDIENMWANWLKNVVIKSAHSEGDTTEYELISPGRNPLTFEPAFYKTTLQLVHGKISLSQVELFNKKDNSLVSQSKILATKQLSNNNLALPSKIESKYYLNGHILCQDTITWDSGDVNMVAPQSLMFDPLDGDLQSIRDMDSKVTMQVPR